jgi:hypothetical protein
VLLVVVVSMPVVMAPKQGKAVRDYSNDPRLDTLRSFFRRGDCPAERFSHVFLEAADAYHLDWRLLPSLSFVESTGGKSAPNNNMFGWNSGRTRFSSLEAGIHSVGYWLTHLPVYRGKQLDSLLATYNPDENYGRTVKFVMRSIAPK